MHVKLLACRRVYKKFLIFSNNFEFSNFSVKYVICSIKLNFTTIFVTDLFAIDPVLSNSTWFDKCKWSLTWVVAILRERSWPCYPVFLFQKVIHKTAKTKKTKCKIKQKSESRILKKVMGFFSCGKWSSNGFASTTT